MTDEELQAAADEAERLALEEADKEAETKAKEKTGDKPKPSDAEAKLLKELMKIKADKKTAEDKARNLETKFDGIDIEALLEAAKKAEDLENKELEKRGEYERLQQKTKDAHAKEMQDLKDKIKELSETAKIAKKETEAATVTNAFSNSRFVLDNLTLTPNKTKALYGDYFDMEDGVLVAYDKPRNSGGRTKIVDGAGDSVAFDEAMKQIIEADPDKETLIKSNLGAGSGSQGNRGEFKPKNEKKTLTAFEKMVQGLTEQKLV